MKAALQLNDYPLMRSSGARIVFELQKDQEGQYFQDVEAQEVVFWYVLANVNLLEWSEAERVLSEITTLDLSFCSLANKYLYYFLNACTNLFLNHYDKGGTSIDSARSLLREAKESDIFFSARQDEYVLDYLEARVRLNSGDIPAARKLLLHASRL